ncbi:hypothetical protein [Herbihabitans rhizosphaerae]|uniref:hypothetical protein n=1 Tax=Herbihabitans rhizosphaerae TaxID=1872711 RepID=UPI001A917D6A|nr:hypothetical protein [Herbihabitans rhizosphaerae]
MGVDQVVDRLGVVDPAVMVEDPGDHALAGVQRPLVEVHLRLLPGGARGGHVQRDLGLGHRHQRVLLEEVGVYQRLAGQIVDVGHRTRCVGPQRGEELRALRVPRVDLVHRVDEQVVAVLFVRRQVAQLGDRGQGHRIGNLDRVKVRTQRNTP